MGEASTVVHTGPSFPSQQIVLSSSFIKVSFQPKKSLRSPPLKEYDTALVFTDALSARHVFSVVPKNVVGSFADLVSFLINGPQGSGVQPESGV